MTTIFSSSDTEPLNSDINCCTAATVLNILLSRGKLSTFGALTDWPVACCSYWCKGTGTLGSIVALTLRYNHFAPTEQKTPLPTTLIVVCLWICCLETGSSIVACVFFAAGMCLPIRSLETDWITPLFIRLLHSNGCPRYNILSMICGAKLTLSSGRTQY
jgi:hypothetical protein